MPFKQKRLEIFCSQIFATSKNGQQYPQISDSLLIYFGNKINISKLSLELIGSAEQNPVTNAYFSRRGQRATELNGLYDAGPAFEGCKRNIVTALAGLLIKAVRGVISGQEILTFIILMNSFCKKICNSNDRNNFIFQ
jgi:hypothetical protein